MAKLAFVALDGCLFSSINDLIDAFGIANRWRRVLDDSVDDDLFETQILSMDGSIVKANGNVRIQPDRAVPKTCHADMIFVPAFADMRHLSSPQTRAVIAWITAQHRRGIPLAATCTGSFLLAETGLLDGRVATTNWHFARMFQHRYPKVKLDIDRMMTETDGLICTAAATAIFNLALHLIQRFGGESLASICAKSILVDPNRQSQAPYAVFHSNKGHGDTPVLEAQAWMEENFARTISIDEIARQVGISPRHFKRRFKKATGAAPIAYLQSVRIQAAKEKLESTQQSVNEITYGIGYEDSSTFRRLFKREVGLSPREYRDKFCRVPA